MYNVMTKQKTGYFNIRINPQTLLDLEVVAELRGTTKSGLIHQFIVAAIREEKQLAPEAFVAPRAAKEEDLIMNKRGPGIVAGRGAPSRKMRAVPGAEGRSAAQAALFSAPDDVVAPFPGADAKTGKKSTSRAKTLRKDEQDARAAARKRLVQKATKK
jgi:hypothetical protein